jgi:DnaJ-class molecular chaperone
MDYYSILGVSRNASEQDIRKAYKKQSMQHHPDRGGDEEQFKKINEAYSTLKDPIKRQQYDNPQPQFNFNTSNMGGFEDIFAHAFGQGFARQQRPRNADVNIKVVLDFEEQLTGKSIIAAYRLKNGQEERVDLEIPPGVKHGDKIRYDSLGDNSLPGKRGDLFVIINVKRKHGWRRSNDDIVVVQKVNCLDLITGTTVQVSTLSGNKIDLKIPKGTKNNTTFNVPGYGIPNLRSGVKGNMLITIDAEIPILNDEQIDAINKLK